MNRDEIIEMRKVFREKTGRLLDAELGVYGEGEMFTELSGDDRLRMERAMLGVPRTDRERLEAAAFAIAQQRRETGGLGRWLAGGSLAEEAMDATERRLLTSAGVRSSDFSNRGILLSKDNFNFNVQGDYIGPSRETFLTAASSAQQVAQNYATRIDAYANIATTGIAILGAIAAAVITVATGGAAGPLIAAAVIAGLASMGANYALKGGRYGWEQAAVDLGMTAVQAVTAGGRRTAGPSRSDSLQGRGGGQPGQPHAHQSGAHLYWQPGYRPDYHWRRHWQSRQPRQRGAARANLGTWWRTRGQCLIRRFAQGCVVGSRNRGRHQQD